LIIQNIVIGPIYSLPGGGQKAKKGSIMNVFNDTEDVKNALPNAIDACQITIVRHAKPGQTNHRDLVVNPERVLSALELLKTINKDYYDIEILSDHKEATLNEFRLFDEVESAEEEEEICESNFEDEDTQHTFSWGNHTNDSTDELLKI
jgi:hypothetical protein